MTQEREKQNENKYIKTQKNYKRSLIDYEQSLMYNMCYFYVLCT